MRIPSPAGEGKRRQNQAPVDNKSKRRLTGPVNHGVLFKVICFAQNPSAAMRGGFLRCGAAINNDTRHSPMRNCASGNDGRWIGPVRSTMPDSSPAPVDKTRLALRAPCEAMSGQQGCARKLHPIRVDSPGDAPAGSDRFGLVLHGAVIRARDGRNIF